MSASASDPDWYTIVSSCGLAGISGNILWNCIVDSVSEDMYRLTLDENQSALFDPDKQAAIASSISGYLKRPVSVVIQVAAVGSETPAARRRREKSEAVAAVHQSFYQDSGVQALLTTFDARVDADSLQISR